MIISTPGLVLHTIPYGDSSVVAKVFTRQLGVRSYIIKNVRGPRGRVKQNLLQPLSCIDMVVYDNPHTDLNHIKEITPRHLSTYQPVNVASENALRFFMTEVLYKSLSEAEPMQGLWDYVEGRAWSGETRNVPIRFMLGVAHHLGIEPLDNHSVHEPYFDLQEGRFVGAPTETTLPLSLSSLLHEYIVNLAGQQSSEASTLNDRRSLIDALLAYYQMHLPGFRNFHSHEILHTLLR